MFITGVFAFAGFAHPTPKLLPEAYYTIQNPTRLKKLYKLLRVDWFRKCLLATLWRGQGQRKNYFDGTKQGIQEFSKNSMKSEFGHLLPFAILNLISIYLLALNMPALVFFATAFNILGNLYPIILQRHHRMRLQLLSKRPQVSFSVS